MRKRSVVCVAALVAGMGVAIQGPSQAAAEPVPTNAFGDAKAFEYARKSGHKVEITSRTTSTTRAWANPNGLTTVQIYAAPVRMRKDGEWKDFDLTLVKRPNGSIAPKVHPGDLVLSGAVSGAGEHDLATVTADGGRVGVRWRGTLPEPKLKGAKATYVDVAPGVDLVVEARTGGFEQFLVLKDRSAATWVANLRLSVNPGKGRFDPATKTWRNGDGKVVGRMPPAVMWDAQPIGPDGERPRKAKVEIRDQVVTPDLAWLNDPATRYPVTIDPGIDVSRPIGFDEFVQNTIDISDNQSTSELKLGYSDASDCMAITSQGCRARSYLRFDGLQSYGGAVLKSASLTLWEFHSWSCSAFGWRATRTAWVDGSVQWGNQPAWEEFGPVTSATRGYSASCDDGEVSTDAAPLLDDVLATSGDSLSMVIHADGDNSRDGWSTTNHNSWKKFDSAQGAHPPYLSFSYNNLPSASEFRLEGDSTCGQGANNRKYLPHANKTPTFSATIADPDSANNVQLEVELTPEGGPTTSRYSVVGVPGLHSVTWSPELDTSKTYTYRVRAYDIRAQDGAIMDYTPWSPTCEFGYDNNTIEFAPTVLVPTVEGEEGPVPILTYGQATQVTFQANPADVGKVAGYRFGFSQEAVESPNAPTVVAGPDGSASAMVTNWEIDSEGYPLQSVSSLYVRAVSITGAYFSQQTIEGIQNLNFDPAPETHTGGDFNGDGLADVLGVQKLTAPAGTDLLYVRHGDGAGGVSAPTNLLTINENAEHQFATGDFNGDGRSEFVSLVADGASKIKISVAKSDANRLVQQEVWTSGSSNAWPFASTRLAVGDLNGDHRDDLIVALGNGTTNYQFKVFIAKSSPEYYFEEPVNWLASPIAGDVAKIKLVTGFFDAGATRDVGVFERVSTCQTRLRIHTNNGSSLSAGSVPFDNSNWCWDDFTFVAGEFDAASGQSGIVAAGFAHSDTNACKTVNFYSFTQPYTAAVSQWQSAANNRYWCADRVEPMLLNVAGDGRADLVVSYKEAGTYQQRVWALTTSGAPGVNGTFANPTELARGAVGPLGTRSVLANPAADVNNDDVADLGFLFVHGGGEVDYMTSYGSTTSMFPTNSAWSLPGGSWAADRVLYVPGDYDGDGFRDGGFYYSNADGSGWFKVSYGSATGPGSSLTQLWPAPAGSYDRYHITMQSGDFDGDGDDDLGVYVGGDDNSVTYKIGLSNGRTMAAPVQGWTLPAGTWDRYKIMHVVGDFDGNGKDDAGFYFGDTDDSGWLKVAYNTLNSNSLTNKFNIPATGFRLANMQVCGGDFTGDGKDDLGVLYTYYDGAAKEFMAVTQPDNSMAGFAEKWYQGPGTQSLDRVRIACADYNGDGQDDMGILRTASDLSASFHVAYSTAAGANAAVQQWSKVAQWGALPNAQIAASSAMVPVPPPPDPPPYCTYRGMISPGINVRNGPGTNYSILGSIPYNSTVKGHQFITQYAGGYYWRPVYGSWGSGWAVTQQGSTVWLAQTADPCTYS